MAAQRPSHGRFVGKPYLTRLGKSSPSLGSNPDRRRRGLLCARPRCRTNLGVYYHPHCTLAPDRRLGVAKKFVIVLPVALDFAHDALEFGISAEAVPVLIALKPGKIMISKLNRPSQPGESGLFLSQ